MTVTITTSISLHAKDKKISNFTARNDKLIFLGTSKVPVCPEYLYGKMTVHAPTLIKNLKPQ